MTVGKDFVIEVSVDPIPSSEDVYVQLTIPIELPLRQPYLDILQDEGWTVRRGKTRDDYEIRRTIRVAAGSGARDGPR